MDVPDRLVAPRAVRYALVVGFAGYVLVASGIDPPTGGGPPLTLFGLPLDKVLHAGAYATLAGLLAYAALPRGWPALLAVALAATAYGAGIEVVQTFLPRRTFDLLDLAANGVGAAVAAGVWPALVRGLSIVTPHAGGPGDRSIARERREAAGIDGGDGGDDAER